MADGNVSVTYDTPSTDPGNTLDNLFTLCKKSTEIKTSVISALGKTVMGDVTVAQLKTNSQITKTFLGESLMSLI